MTDPIKPPKVPCGTCPYRRDVPGGIWHPDEYRKLPEYDRETWEQPQALFLCHRRDGCLCGGWLLTHGTDELLALRLHAGELDPSVWSYAPPGVEVFASGAEAAAHGIATIDNPTDAARRKVEGLLKQRLKNPN